MLKLIPIYQRCSNNLPFLASSSGRLAGWLCDSLNRFVIPWFHWTVGADWLLFMLNHYYATPALEFISYIKIKFINPPFILHYSVIKSAPQTALSQVNCHHQTFNIWKLDKIPILLWMGLFLPLPSFPPPIFKVPEILGMTINMIIVYCVGRESFFKFIWLIIY